MRACERCLAALEALLKPLPPGEHELRHVLPMFLTFDEICAGQHALEPFGDDPVAAIEANDPVMVALVAVARLRC